MLSAQLCAAGLCRQVSASERPRKRPRGPACTDLAACYEEMQLQTCSCGRACFRLLRANLKDYLRVLADKRTELQTKKRGGDTLQLFRWLLAMRRVKEYGKFEVDFQLEGVGVCKDAWCKFLGFNAKDSRIKRLLAAVRRGDTEWVSAKSMVPSSARSSFKGEWTKAWVRDYIKRNAEWCPSKQVVSIEPNPHEVHHMLYVSAWQNRYTANQRGPPLRVGQFIRWWKHVRGRPLIVEGRSWKIKARAPR